MTCPAGGCSETHHSIKTACSKRVLTGRRRRRGIGRNGGIGRDGKLEPGLLKEPSLQGFFGGGGGGDKTLKRATIVLDTSRERRVDRRIQYGCMLDNSPAWGLGWVRRVLGWAMGACSLQAIGSRDPAGLVHMCMPLGDHAVASTSWKELPPHAGTAASCHDRSPALPKRVRRHEQLAAACVAPSNGSITRVRQRTSLSTTLGSLDTLTSVSANAVVPAHAAVVQRVGGHTACPSEHA